MIGYIRPKGVLVISKMDINGKVALVTGGAGGIGRAMVDILLQTNAKVSCKIQSSESFKNEGFRSSFRNCFRI